MNIFRLAVFVFFFFGEDREHVGRALNGKLYDIVVSCSVRLRKYAFKSLIRALNGCLLIQIPENVALGTKSHEARIGAGREIPHVWSWARSVLTGAGRTLTAVVMG